MLAYLILLIVTLFAIVQYDFGEKKGISNIIWWSICVYVILLIGLRYRVGIDTLNYMNHYSSFPKITEVSEFGWQINYQPLYYLMSVISRSISEDFVIFQLIHAVILNIIIFSFISKNTEFKFTGLFFYFILYFLYFNTEILKESLAIAIFLLNYENLREKRWRRYYFGVLISFLFHFSAIILVFFPLFTFFKLNWRFILTSLLFIITLVLIEPYLRLFEAYGVIGNKLSSYLNSSDLNLNYKIFRLIEVTVLPFFLLIYQKYILKEESKFDSIVLIHIIIGIGVIFYPIIFARFSNYTMPFFALFVSQLIFVAYKKSISGKLGAIVCLTLVLFVFGYDYFTPVANSSKKYKQWVPYHSILNREEDSEREEIWRNKFIRINSVW